MKMNLCTLLFLLLTQFTVVLSSTNNDLWRTSDTTSIVALETPDTYSSAVTEQLMNSELHQLELQNNFIAHPDFEILRNLYESAGGSNWKNDEGWREAITENGSCDPCSGPWYGITCSQGRVTNINLNGNNLEGFIDPSVSGMTLLNNLDLRFNDLSGTIPEDIGNMASLSSLQLSGNRLTGDIPSALIDADSLSILNLSNNSLTGIIPNEIGNSNLSLMDLSNNQISGNIPPSVVESSLSVIRLYNNNIEGEIPEGITTMSNLEILQLDNNSLSGILPEGFGSISSLRTISFSNNNLDGCFPSDIESICALGFTELDTSNDPTPGYNFTGNPLLPWEGVVDNVCNGEDQIDAPCNNGNPNLDTINGNCECSSVVSTFDIEGGQIKVFPNPVVDHLTLEIIDIEDVTWSIVNAAGQLVDRGVVVGLAGSHQIDLQSLTSGLYNILIFDEEGERVVTSKFSKL